MLYLIVYSAFSYLIILGIILGELASGIKPNGWQMAFFVFAPVFLPVYTGNWMFHIINPDAKNTETVTQERVKVEITKP